MAICNRFIKTSLAALIASFSLVNMVAAEPIEIEGSAIKISTIGSDAVRFNDLYWRGGLVLKSDSKNFGGLSGIEVSTDGKRLLAISDRGQWLKARIDYEDGVISGLSDTQMSPLLNAKGGRFKSWQIDSEGMTKRNDRLDDVIISSERSQALFRYKLGNRLAAAGMEWGSIADARKISANRGLEGITTLPKSHKYRGWILAIAERKLDKNRNHTAWLVNGKINHSLNIKRYGGFDITDVNYLPNGDIVILERAIGLLSGASMRIRQVCGKDIKPDALVDGHILIETDWSLSVDNMEGLAVHKASDGETILTVISDDNFHFLQRNLIMQFALVNDKSVCA